MNVAYVLHICFKYFSCLGLMLQQVFSFCKLQVFYLNIVYVSHICCNNMFQIFQLFESYVAVSVFILQVASVLSECCLCFTHILQAYVPDVISVAYVCCMQVLMLHIFHVVRRVRGHGE
jgi:hypothetical protein